jgi:hypothetical protein
MKATNVRKIASELKLLCDAPGHETETSRQCEARLKKTAALQKRLTRIFCREWPCGPWRQATAAYAAIGREFFGKQPTDCFFPTNWTGMSVSALFDHRYFFRSADGFYGIASHLYDCNAHKRGQIEAFCDRYGLCAEYPDFPSWYYPGRTTFVWWTNLKPE